MEGVGRVALPKLFEKHGKDKQYYLLFFEIKRKKGKVTPGVLIVLEK